MPTISFIVPALNEEKNIRATVECIDLVAAQYFEKWEILVFNDGSQDQTQAICEKLKAERPYLKVFSHETPQNLGYCYRRGIEEASLEYAIMIPGDNECGAPVMHQIFEKLGKAQIINPYISNQKERPWVRRNLSFSYTRLINLLSGCRLSYYNGPVLHHTQSVKNFGVRTRGFSYQTDLLIRMVKSGASVCEVGIPIQYRTEGRSKAFRVKNLIQVASFLWQIFIENRVKTYEKVQYRHSNV